MTFTGPRAWDLKSLGAIIQHIVEYLSKEAGRMGGCHHRIGVIVRFYYLTSKIISSCHFRSDTVSGDVEVKDRTIRVVSKVEKRRNLLNMRSRG